MAIVYKKNASVGGNPSISWILEQREAHLLVTPPTELSSVETKRLLRKEKLTEV